MSLVDANLLVYAKVEDFDEHRRCRDWLEELLNSPGRVGLPWGSLLAFLRVVTSPRIFDRPLDADAAFSQVEEWIRLPGVWIPEPTDEHAVILGRFVRDLRLTANLVPDAHLASLAVEHGLELFSADGDFARFPGLRWTNPLTRS